MDITIKRVCFVILKLFVVTVFVNEAECYEKTLRKIVRNQNKMVAQPFSAAEKDSIMWINTTQRKHSHDDHLIPIGTNTQIKSMYHQKLRPKMEIISSIDTARSKSAYSKVKLSYSESPLDPRLTRNTYTNTTGENLDKTSYNYFGSDNNMSFASPSKTKSKIPLSSFFPPVDDEREEIDIKPMENTHEAKATPENEHNLHSSVVYTKSKISDINYNSLEQVNNLNNQESEITGVVKADTDFLIEETRLSKKTDFKYNMPVNSHVCSVLPKYAADIDAQEKFNDFDIEPKWIPKKHFWDNIYESRYESLMRSPKWPTLKVILIPRTHVDTVWKKSFAEYSVSVNRILTNVVKKLPFYPNLTFSWNEVSHLSNWWKKTTAKNRITLRQLLKNGRFEITTGGWVETDEATSHIYGLLHQLIEGHQWLKQNLNYTPSVAWLTNTLSHSPTMTYLLSASGISNVVLTNLHYSWEEFLAEFQFSDFIWVQSWDNDIMTKSKLNMDLQTIGIKRFPKHSVFTHFIQFNSAGFRACGPNANICVNNFDFGHPGKHIEVNNDNVKDISESLLEQYSKTGTLSSHNTVIAPLGGPFHYEVPKEFDTQYNNYNKIAAYINDNSDIYKSTIEFGTAKDYFKQVINRHKEYSSISGDFLNFADVSLGSPAYWSGYFTSRPSLKILLRRFQSTMRSTEILLSYCINLKALRVANASELFEMLSKSREVLARLQDRNVMGSTLTANVLKYVNNQIETAIKYCWQIQEIAASLLTAKPEVRNSYLKKFVYRNGELITLSKLVSVGDQLYFFNPLSYERTEIVELITNKPNIRIVDHLKRDVTIQINPIWKYSQDNRVKITLKYFKVIFVVVISPLTLVLFKIKETFDATHNAATIYCAVCDFEDVSNKMTPFNIQPIEEGDIQIESYKFRLIFDESSGLLKSVFEKETNKVKSVVIEFGAFRSSDSNSGMFLFNTNVTKPLEDILIPYRTGKETKVVMLLAGSVTTELTIVYGKLLQHTIKVVNLLKSPLSNAIYIETRVDYEMSPKNREIELFLSIKTDILNGNPPKIYTDNNGFQFTSRFIKVNKGIESNLYPITSMVFIEDSVSRMTFLTNHAQGVTAFQEGQIVLMLDRRVLFNDQRGVGEGLADSGVTWHRNYLLLENLFKNSNEIENTENNNMALPSLSAHYLADCLSYSVDVFIIEKNVSHQSYYNFLPLLKTSFPCDVGIVSYRIVLNHETSIEFPNTALMILQRRSFSCHINHNVYINCNGDNNFDLSKILRSVHNIYKTNIVSTDVGIKLNKFTLQNFPPMELITLKIYFDK